MKRIVLFAIAVVTMTAGSLAQRRGEPPPPPPPLEPGASQADVDKALVAAPASLKDQATVIKWKKDFTYDTLRKGTNRLVCYDRSGSRCSSRSRFSARASAIWNGKRRT